VNQRHFIVFILYCLLTLVLTYPLVCQMNTVLIGSSSDVYINPWADWWTRKTLNEGLDFYHTDYIFYPQGASLVFHSFSHTNTAISLLFTPLIGRWAAYNLTILLAYILSGFSMYLLCLDLTDCALSAFLAGVVFSFCPYHMFESAHPVLVTTQWIPLFAMVFLRAFRDAHTNWLRKSLLAALCFVLNALSSWHLMIMLSGWIALYLFYTLLFERTIWTPNVFWFLLVFVIISVVAISPFLWPIVHEQLTEDTTYMAVDVENGLGNDLLSFIVPNRRHPLFSTYFAKVYEDIGFIEKRPAYIGYVPLILMIVGVSVAHRETRFWLGSGLLFFVLSLGAQVTLNGKPLHQFDLPWAVPIIQLLRHPFRLNILLFFSLSILLGFGARWLYLKMSHKPPILISIILFVVFAFIFLEYLIYPFPTTPIAYSSIFPQLALEDGDFAVANFPMGRKEAKYYLFYQTIHGKKIVDGVVSRTPHNAYAFVEADPLMQAMRNENVPDLYIEERLAVLAAQDIRYILVHKDLLSADRLDNWRKWLSHLPAPVHEDEYLIAYQTAPALRTERLQEEDLIRLDVQFGENIWLRSYRFSAPALTADEPLTVTLFWQANNQIARDENYHVFVHLIDAEGQLVAQHDGAPVYGERPTWSWRSGEVIEDEHPIAIIPDLTAASYTLSVGMYDFSTSVRLPTVHPNGERYLDDSVPLEELQRCGN
jgi:hypothetical protein